MVLQESRIPREWFFGYSPNAILFIIFIKYSLEKHIRNPYCKVEGGRGRKRQQYLCIVTWRKSDEHNPCRPSFPHRNSKPFDSLLRLLLHFLVCLDGIHFLPAAQPINKFVEFVEGRGCPQQGPRSLGQMVCPVVCQLLCDALVLLDGGNEVTHLRRNRHRQHRIRSIHLQHSSGRWDRRGWTRELELRIGLG